MGNTGRKIIILREILSYYSNYLSYFNKATCYTYKLKTVANKGVIKDLTKNKYKPYVYNNLTFCIYFHGDKAINTMKRRPLIKDIDSVLIRYRSKLFNERKKWDDKINKIELLRQNTKFY